MFLLLGTGSFAQHNVYSSMFWKNYAYLNPATSGLEHKTHAAALYRNQWPNITQPYQTGFINANMRLGETQGIGVNYTIDKWGFCRIQQFKGNYNYQINLAENSKLSLGVAGSYFTTHCNENDETNNEDGINLNVDFGIAYIWNNLLIHGSINNLIQENPNSLNENNAINTPGKGFNVGASYDFHLGKRFTLKPQFLGQYSNGFTRINMNMLLSFKEKYCIGASMTARNNYALIAGINFKKKFRVTYSCDKTLSKLTNANAGAHEISIGYYLK